MRLPTNNWVTCNAACHGYLATDYSWHISKYNYVSRKTLYAIEDGKVTSIGRTGDCGNRIDFSGKSGRTYRYCHLERIDVTTGQSVKEGQIVGKIGSTGKSTGPHLHLVMWVDGKRVDPDKTIRAIIAKENEVTKPTAKEVISIFNRYIGHAPSKKEIEYYTARRIGVLYEAAAGVQKKRIAAQKAAIADMKVVISNVKKALAASNLKVEEQNEKAKAAAEQLTIVQAQLEESEKKAEEALNKLAVAEDRATQNEEAVVGGFFSWIKNLFLNRNKD